MKKRAIVLAALGLAFTSVTLSQCHSSEPTETIAEYEETVAVFSKDSAVLEYGFLPDKKFPKNCIPVPGEDGVYAVISDDVYFVRYDGSSNWADKSRKIQITTALLPVDGDPFLWNEVPESGEEGSLYYRYARYADGFYVFRMCGPDGKLLWNSNETHALFGYIDNDMPKGFMPVPYAEESDAYVSMRSGKLTFYQRTSEGWKEIPAVHSRFMPLDRSGLWGNFNEQGRMVGSYRYHGPETEEDNYYYFEVSM